jgi:hypothetical protein
MSRNRSNSALLCRAPRLDLADYGRRERLAWRLRSELRENPPQHADARRERGSAALGACLLVLTWIALDLVPMPRQAKTVLNDVILALAANLVLGRHLLTLMAYR